MLRASLFALLSGTLVLTAGSVAQEPKKDDPPKSAKKDDAKPAKKDETETKLKGSLPRGYGKLGLSDDQKQEIYKIQAKHDAEIDKLLAKIAEHKAARAKEVKAVLTAEQKKRLEDALLGKDR